MHNSLATSIFAFSLFTIVHSQTCGNCQSFGSDFQDGGEYFQNSLSTDPFTASQYFEGCTNDTSHNILVAPDETEYECTMTPIEPDDTTQTFSCPIDKDQLYGGEWNILVISNNGDCDPIDFQRSFSLDVGPQSTTTVSPTIVVSTTTTPVQSTTLTSTQTITSTAKATTTIEPKATINPTITIYPPPVITVVTKAILTITKTSQIASVVATTIVTKPCQKLAKARIADPIATLFATILGQKSKRDALPMPTARSGSTEFKRAILEGHQPRDKAGPAPVEKRADRPALRKRAPDAPTITVTNTNGTPVTSTSTSTAPTQTVTGTTTLLRTTTTTPTVTLTGGATLTIATVTAPAKTLTNTFFIPLTTVYTTATQAATLTITSTASCS